MRRKRDSYVQDNHAGRIPAHPIPQGNHHVELIQPDDLPPIVRIGWPLQPTVIDPERFRDVAAALVKLFSEAHLTLTHIRARRYRHEPYR